MHRINKSSRLKNLPPKSKNIVATVSGVSLSRREARNGHRGCVLWFTGLSASGKSTIANELEAELFRRGCQASCWTATAFGTVCAATWGFPELTGRKTSGAWAKWRGCLRMRVSFCICGVHFTLSRRPQDGARHDDRREIH